MGAAASVPEGDGAAPPAEKTDTHKALVYDTVYSNFEQRLLPKPGSKPKPPAANAPKRNSLFAEKAPAPVADPAAEPEPEPDPAGMASYEGPFFQDLDANAKDALIVEMRTTAQLIEQQISDGTWPAPEKPPDELHYKMDVVRGRRCCRLTPRAPLMHTHTLSRSTTWCSSRSRTRRRRRPTRARLRSASPRTPS